jgi:hypothetical protein
MIRLSNSASASACNPLFFKGRGIVQRTPQPGPPENAAHVLGDDLAGLREATALTARRSDHDEDHLDHSGGAKSLRTLSYAAFRWVTLVLLVRIELMTSPLPRGNPPFASVCRCLPSTQYLNVSRSFRLLSFDKRCGDLQKSAT